MSVRLGKVFAECWGCAAPLTVGQFIKFGDPFCSPVCKENWKAEQEGKGLSRDWKRPLWKTDGRGSAGQSLADCVAPWDELCAAFLEAVTVPPETPGAVPYKGVYFWASTIPAPSVGRYVPRWVNEAMRDTERLFPGRGSRKKTPEERADEEYELKKADEQAAYGEQLDQLAKMLAGVFGDSQRALVQRLVVDFDGSEREHVEARADGYRRWLTGQRPTVN